MNLSGMNAVSLFSRFFCGKWLYFYVNYLWRWIMALTHFLCTFKHRLYFEAFRRFLKFFLWNWKVRNCCSSNLDFQRETDFLFEVISWKASKSSGSLIKLNPENKILKHWKTILHLQRFFKSIFQTSCH